ncbi:transposase [Helcococcus kunzii]|uniref:transposase n=1 Tax=Helcococcus kunzii TaxID=40091 RepID=UPI00389D96B6
MNETINRSIQAEGAFSKLKEALVYKRFNHKGLTNVVIEINIMAIAMNLNTLTNKIFNKDYAPTRYQISENNSVNSEKTLKNISSFLALIFPL